MPQQQETDEFDEILDWMCDVYQTGGDDLTKYKVTLQNNQLKTISDKDANTTIFLSSNPNQPNDVFRQSKSSS
jgi:hypothetical protein